MNRTDCVFMWKKNLNVGVFYWAYMCICNTSLCVCKALVYLHIKIYNNICIMYIVTEVSQTVYLFIIVWFWFILFRNSCCLFCFHEHELKKNLFEYYFAMSLKKYGWMIDWMKVWVFYLLKGSYCFVLKFLYFQHFVVKMKTSVVCYVAGCKTTVFIRNKLEKENRKWKILFKNFFS